MKLVVDVFFYLVTLNLPEHPPLFHRGPFRFARWVSSYYLPENIP